VETFDDLMPPIIPAQSSHRLPGDISAMRVNRPMIDGTLNANQQSKWKVFAGVLTFEGRIDVPTVDSLPRKVISLFHDNPESSHFGALKTTKLEGWDLY